MLRLFSYKKNIINPTKCVTIEVTFGWQYRQFTPDCECMFADVCKEDCELKWPFSPIRPSEDVPVRFKATKMKDPIYLKKVTSLQEDTDKEYCHTTPDREEEGKCPISSCYTTNIIMLTWLCPSKNWNHIVELFFKFQLNFDLSFWTENEKG